MPLQGWRAEQQQLRALALKLQIFIPVYPEVEETSVLVNISYDLQSHLPLPPGLIVLFWVAFPLLVGKVG